MKGRRQSPLARFTVREPSLTPERTHVRDAAVDLKTPHDIVLGPGTRIAVGTGVIVSVPDGYVGLVCPRSGLAAEHGVTVLNAPGVIDPGYTGEVIVVLINHDPATTFRAKAGDRIAQLIVTPTLHLPGGGTDRDRGPSGLGSTGHS